ncbi:hypothetical protein F4809DRAFT_628431 [Biscogniauxia mediterranea]|nr:hypothetical protein F4809DRAFT_628431 [Biscogniauxia mediterranea]
MSEMVISDYRSCSLLFVLIRLSSLIIRLACITDMSNSLTWWLFHWYLVDEDSLILSISLLVLLVQPRARRGAILSSVVVGLGLILSWGSLTGGTFGELVQYWVDAVIGGLSSTRLHFIEWTFLGLAM